MKKVFLVLLLIPVASADPTLETSGDSVDYEWRADGIEGESREVTRDSDSGYLNYTYPIESSADEFEISVRFQSNSQIPIVGNISIFTEDGRYFATSYSSVGENNGVKSITIDEGVDWVDSNGGDANPSGVITAVSFRVGESVDSSFEGTFDSLRVDGGPDLIERESYAGDVYIQSEAGQIDEDVTITGGKENINGTLEITLSNEGETEQTVNISSRSGNITDKSVDLRADETRDITLNIIFSDLDIQEYQEELVIETESEEDVVISGQVLRSSQGIGSFELTDSLRDPPVIGGIILLVGLIIGRILS